MAEDGDMREQARKMLERLRGLEGVVTRATKRTLQLHGERWRSEMVRRFQPWTRGFRHGGDSPIRRRSSNLLRSMSVELTGETIDDLKLTESAGGSESAPYARLQELGGTITPKRGKWLAIPMDAALTASGQPKRGFESPRFVEDLFFFQTNRDVAQNRAWLVRRKDWQRGSPALDSEEPRTVREKRKPAKLEFLYMLVKSVTVKPRLGMRETEERLAPKRVSDFWSSVRRELGTVGGA